MVIMVFVIGGIGMTTRTMFVNRHIAQLPFKYAIMSVSTYLHKNSAHTMKGEQEGIDNQYLKFIEVPLTGAHKH